MKYIIYISYFFSFMALYAQNINYSKVEKPLSLQNKFKTNLLNKGIYPANHQVFTIKQSPSIQLSTNIPTLYTKDIIKYYGVQNFQIAFTRLQNTYIGLGGLIANQGNTRWVINQNTTIDVGLTAAKQYTYVNQYPYSVFGSSANIGYFLNKGFQVNVYAQYMHYSENDPIAKLNPLFLQTETGMNVTYQKDNISIGAGQKTMYKTGFGGTSTPTIQTHAKFRFK